MGRVHPASLGPQMSPEGIGSAFLVFGKNEKYFLDASRKPSEVWEVQGQSLHPTKQLLDVTKRRFSCILEAPLWIPLSMDIIICVGSRNRLPYILRNS